MALPLAPGAADTMGCIPSTLTCGYFDPPNVLETCIQKLQEYTQERDIGHWERRTHPPSHLPSSRRTLGALEDIL